MDNNALEFGNRRFNQRLQQWSTKDSTINSFCERNIFSGRMINVCTFDDTTNFLNSIVSKKQLVSNLNKKCSIYVLYLVGILECFEGTFDLTH